MFSALDVMESEGDDHFEHQHQHQYQQHQHQHQHHQQQRRGSWASDVVMCNGATSSIGGYTYSAGSGSHGGDNNYDGEQQQEEQFRSFVSTPSMEEGRDRLLRMISYDDDTSEHHQQQRQQRHDNPHYSRQIRRRFRNRYQEIEQDEEDDHQESGNKSPTNEDSSSQEEDEETQLRRLVSYEDDNNSHHQQYLDNVNVNDNVNNQEDNNSQQNSSTAGSQTQNITVTRGSARRPTQQQQLPSSTRKQRPEYKCNNSYDDETNRIIMRMRLRMGSLFDQEETTSPRNQNAYDDHDHEAAAVVVSEDKNENDDPLEQPNHDYLEESKFHENGWVHHDAEGDDVPQPASYGLSTFDEWEQRRHMMRQLPPPPPPPPPPRQQIPFLESSSPYFTPSSLPQNSHEEENEDFQPALCQSDASKSTSTESQAMSIIHKQLASYAEIIRRRLQNDSMPHDYTKQMELTDVHGLMLRDPNLSEREAAAFLQGVKLRLAATNTPPLNHSIQQGRFDGKSPNANSTIGASPNHPVLGLNSSRIMALRRNAVHEDDHDDALTSISVMSTMSCRELSIQRVRRKIAFSRRTWNQDDEEEKKQQEPQIDPNNERVSKLLQELQEAEARQKRLEKQLQQAGVCLAEDIPYEEAKEQVAQISRRMQEIGDSQAVHPDPIIQAQLREEYFVLEQKMETYMRALELTDEYLEEQDRMERAWDAENEEENRIALKQVWDHMPVEFRNRNWKEWMEMPAPNGKTVPKEFLLKFSRTNVLTLLRMPPHQVQRAHPSTLEQRGATGLTLTERRALYAYLKPISLKWKETKDPLTQRKWKWFNMIRNTFKEAQLSYQHHVNQHGKGRNGNGTCPCKELKCPVRANSKLNYFLEDYGYPCDWDNPQYEGGHEHATAAESNPNDSAKNNIVPTKSSQEQEQQEQERQAALKKHYRGNILEVSMANASCVAMDELMDKLEQLQDAWIQDQWSTPSNHDTKGNSDLETACVTKFNEALVELRLGLVPIAERAGLAMTGAKSNSSNQAVTSDTRSLLETGLCDDLVQVTMDFVSYIKDETTKRSLQDKRLSSMMEQLEQLLEELHTQNSLSRAVQLEATDDPPMRTQQRKSRAERTALLWAQHQKQVKLKVKQKAKAAASAAEEKAKAPKLPIVPKQRMGLLEAIAARAKQ